MAIRGFLLGSLFATSATLVIRIRSVGPSREREELTTPDPCAACRE